MNGHLYYHYHSIKRFLTSFIRDKKMVKIHRFEPKLTKKNAKIGFKVTKKGLKPLFLLVSNL